MKTNHKISALYLALTALCGFVLSVQRAGAETNGLSMMIVAAAAAIVLTLCGLGVESLRKKLLLKPAAPDKLGFAMLMLSGLFFVLAAVLFLLQSGAPGLLNTVTALFCGFCGAATLLRLPLRDSGKMAAIYSLIPIFFVSFFLLMFYRSNGDNPYLYQFGYEVALLLAVLLGIYAAVAGRFEKARPRFRSVACSIGLCFLAQEAVSVLMMPQMVLSIPGFSVATVVMLAGCGMLLCHGMFYPSVREVFPEPEESDEPEETEES